jgi:hypothetical protein
VFKRVELIKVGFFFLCVVSLSLASLAELGKRARACSFALRLSRCLHLSLLSLSLFHLASDFSLRLRGIKHTAGPSSFKKASRSSFFALSASLSSSLLFCSLEQTLQPFSSLSLSPPHSNDGQLRLPLRARDRGGTFMSPPGVVGAVAAAAAAEGRKSFDWSVDGKNSTAAATGDSSLSPRPLSLSAPFSRLFLPFSPRQRALVDVSATIAWLLAQENRKTSLADARFHSLFCHFSAPSPFFSSLASSCSPFSFFSFCCPLLHRPPFFTHLRGSSQRAASRWCAEEVEARMSERAGRERETVERFGVAFSSSFSFFSFFLSSSSRPPHSLSQPLPHNHHHHQSRPPPPRQSRTPSRPSKTPSRTSRTPSSTPSRRSPEGTTRRRKKPKRPPLLRPRSQCRPRRTTRASRRPTSRGTATRATTSTTDAWRRRARRTRSASL